MATQSGLVRRLFDLYRNPEELASLYHPEAEVFVAQRSFPSVTEALTARAAQKWTIQAQTVDLQPCSNDCSIVFVTGELLCASQKRYQFANSLMLNRSGDDLSGAQIISDQFAFMRELPPSGPSEDQGPPEPLAATPPAPPKPPQENTNHHQAKAWCDLFRSTGGTQHVTKAPIPAPPSSAAPPKAQKEDELDLPKPPAEIHSSAVFVRHIPSGVSEDVLADLFSQFSSTLPKDGILVARHKPGTAFIDLGSQEAVAAAVLSARQHSLKLNGKALMVEPSKKPVRITGLRAIQKRKGRTTKGATTTE